MVNPQGYHDNQREELNIDPNRDFDYDNTPDKCLKTVAARALETLYAKYVIYAAITFHGGDNVFLIIIILVLNISLGKR